MRGESWVCLDEPERVCAPNTDIQFAGQILLKGDNVCLIQSLQ
jgi:hypothetical protein